MTLLAIFIAVLSCVINATYADVPSSPAKQANFDVSLFLHSFENIDKQIVLTGHVDTMVIVRDNIKFRLGPGELTLFDFGGRRPSAMVFQGNVDFSYSPPDRIEHYQLKKFTGQETLEGRLKSICLFYTVELDCLPDTSALARKVVDREVWSILQKARHDAFDHLKVYLPNRLIGDLLSGGYGTFFYADFRIKKFEHLVFIEDPYKDDQYCLYKLRRTSGHKTYDVYTGYSPANDLVSQRHLKPIDITRYVIKSRIELSGEMNVQCRIHFIPLRWDRQFLYFKWYYKNKVHSAMDSNGDSLIVINGKDEGGFGVVLKRAMAIGEEDYIDVDFECKSLLNIRGVFYVMGQTYWYPINITDDRAAFELIFDCVKDHQVVSSGRNVESRIEGNRRITSWLEDNPVSYFSFNIGVFNSEKVLFEAVPPVVVYMSKNIPHKELAHAFAFHGELSSGDMLGAVGKDVASSLAFYQTLFGPCPFDTIKATEIPFGHGQGSPGVIHLSWMTYQFEDTRGGQQQFRAHEVAHQWWGHMVNNESYRDTWIIEGMAEYCGFLYFQALVEDRKICENVLNNWRRYIFAGSGAGSMGTKAGPMILGHRLICSKSNDYMPVVYTKAAYVFHMLRYLLHDYGTNSDEKFIALLRDLIERYRNRPITTKNLRELIESHIGVDMSWFFEQWVYGIDIPEYIFSYSYDRTPEGKYRVTCHVEQRDVPDDFRMVVPLTIIFDNDKITHLRIWVDQPRQDVELPLLPLEPKKIEFNAYDAVLCKVKYK